MNSSLISQAFKNTKKEKRPALLTYTVAGDNSKKKSLEILKSILENSHCTHHKKPTPYCTPLLLQEFGKKPY